MAKPLRSEQTTRPMDVQFSHFGVLDTGSQSKASLFTSGAINATILALAVLVGLATKKTMEHKEVVTLIAPIPETVKPLPPKPIIKMPKELETPKLKVEPPKIKLPDVKLPDPPKIPEVKMDQPKPMIMPAPPKPMIAAAAPKPTTVNLGKSAAVVNNDAHPAAVRLGQTTASPIQARPSTTAVSLYTATTTQATSARPSTVALGVPGMQSSNNGNGPRAANVTLGSGQPTGQVGGTGAKTVQGVKLGVVGGTPNGTGNGVGRQVVALGRTPEPIVKQATTTKTPLKSGPELIYKPRPSYTPDATAQHIEGVVSLLIHVSANGDTRVIQIVSGLGHGLDENARLVATGMKFRPAHDANGNPIDWEGVVKVTYQLAI